MCQKLHPCHICTWNILMRCMFLSVWFLYQQKENPNFVQRIVNLERLFSVQDIPHSKPLFGPVPFVCLNFPLRHCQVSSIQDNVNSGELAVVSDFVRKICLVASVTECQCHLATACGSRSTVTALSISPRQAMRFYMKKRKYLKTKPKPTLKRPTSPLEW